MSSAAHVYGGGAPLDYRWDVDDGTIVHTGMGATYRGTFSDDGATLAGGWRPDPGSDANDHSSYERDNATHRLNRVAQHGRTSVEGGGELLMVVQPPAPPPVVLLDAPGPLHHLDEVRVTGVDAAPDG